jgi:hypothetical protein
MVAGSYSDEFFFNLSNRSSSSMALGFTQPLTEMSTRKCYSRVERCRRVKMTASPCSVTLLSRQCAIFDIHNPIGLHGLLRDNFILALDFCQMSFQIWQLFVP